jgi:predicted ATP-dependent endonuclease of OLD family
MISEHIEEYSVFSDGFRGVPDGWHTLRAFNFLVGENSSGKSSFLQLLQILDSREHLLYFDVCGIVDGIDTPWDVISRISKSPTGN